MKKLYTISPQYIEALYILLLPLVLLPPVFIVFPFLTSYRIAGVLCVFLLIYVLFSKKNISFQHVFFLFVVIFFIAQSVSVITAINTDAFLTAYENVVYGVLFTAVSWLLLTKRNTDRVFAALVIITGVQILLRFFIFFDIFISQIGTLFLHPSYMDIISMNVSRGRIYIDSYEEAIVPICIYFLIIKKWIKLDVILLCGIIAVSFLSGFRTKLATLILSMGILFIFIESYRRIAVSLFGLSMVVLLFLSFFTSSGDISLIDRLQTDVVDLTSGRELRIKEGIEIGMSSPLFGVGLGNYYDHLTLSMQKSVSPFAQKRMEFDLAVLDPHNIFISIFAETGIVGLTSFFLLLFYFIAKDIFILKKKAHEKVKIIVCSFWILFTYALLNPSTSITYISLFWLFRVLIEKNEPYSIFLTRKSL